MIGYKWFSSRALMFFCLLPLPLACTAETTRADLLRYVIEKVEWPKEALPGKTFRLCTLCSPEHHRDIHVLEATSVKNKKIQITYLTDLRKAKASCHLIYIDKCYKEELSSVLKATTPASILVIGEGAPFAEKGAMMHFLSVDSKAGIAINFDALRQANLSLDLSHFDRLVILPHSRELSPD